MNTIRTASEADIHALSALFDAYRVFYRKESDPDAARNFLRECIGNNESVIFVSENEGLLNGFVQLYPLFSSTRMKRLWLLNDLFVQPEHRGRGLSKALIERAKQHCLETDACGLSLETEKSNLIGRKLYPASGFDPDTDHHFYFWENKKARL